jgi:FKBP-type peptidyl-prolyl cis-trans isomerase SlyD
MKIDLNAVVSVSYKLFANLPSEEKAHIETADSSQPLIFLFGNGSMIPGFEQALNGLAKGDRFDFSIEPADAYGELDEKALVNLPLDIFKVDNVVDFGVLKVGNVLPLTDQEGNRFNAKVISYDDTQVKMDFNHPLAGQQLHFTGEVLDVRAASPDEISHGHVHHDGMGHH